MKAQRNKPPAAALSPNQQAKREALVEAAMQVLRERGYAGCTSRAIADASPLAKSALHYYFEDTEEIVQQAFVRIMEQFVQRVREAAATAGEPRAALRAAAVTYLHLGANRPAEQVPMLWFEVQLAAARRGDTRLVAALTERFLAELEGLVAATGIADAAGRARALLSMLIGMLVRDALAPLALDTELDLNLRLLGLDSPADPHR